MLQIGPPAIPTALDAMKALLCTRYGTPDDLELADIPDPQPAPARRWCGSRPRR